MKSERIKRISLWTIRYGVHKYAVDQGIVVIDARISVGLDLCKPSANLVYNYRNAGKEIQLQQEDFLRGYYEELENSYLRNKPSWQSLLRAKRLAVSCEHTVDDPMAHRHILKFFLCNIAVDNDYEVMHGSEIRCDTRNKTVLMRYE